MNFRELLKKKRISIKELSIRTSIPYSTVNDIVNERIAIENVRFGYVISICDALDISIVELQQISGREKTHSGLLVENKREEVLSFFRR